LTTDENGMTPHPSTTDAERAVHWERVRRQYDDVNGAAFYRIVMGGGGDHVHYGLYESEVESPRSATHRATQKLIEFTARSASLGSNTKIVDFGSGNGGSAHQWILEHGVEVVGVNLCSRQNAANRSRAVELGIIDRLTIEECSFESLPGAWAESFDVVWCQESLCHAADKVAAMGEAFRVLRPGGVMLVSDIVAGERTDAEQLTPFTDRNAVVRLESLARYLEIARQVGFVVTTERDWTEHLATNFKIMLRRIQENHDELVAAGVQRRYLDDFANSLRQRLNSAAERIYVWSVFVAQKSA
jgi:sarcosine/dimethylglycine N-methyltransferase